MKLGKLNGLILPVKRQEQNTKQTQSNETENLKKLSGKQGLITQR